jgi:hypothetical protein
MNSFDRLCDKQKQADESMVKYRINSYKLWYIYESTYYSAE